MSTIKVFLFSILALMIVSCKPDAADTKADKTNDKAISDLEALAAPARDRALNTIEYRRLNIENKSYRTMDSGILVYEAIFDPAVKQVPVAMDGKWIDFHVDFTYDYGTYEVKEGSGTYYYSFGDQLLLMVDDDPTKIPEEFEVKVSGTAHVWVGQNTYSNNGKQMKLIKQDKIPSKS